MPRQGDTVAISGVYRADCPHDVVTTHRFYIGETFGPCPACPEHDPDRPDQRVTWEWTGDRQ